MTNRIAARASLGLALLLGGALAAGAFQSGPEPGDKLTPFDPLHINGPDAGKERCLV